MQTDIFFNIQLAKNGDRNAQSKIIEENTGLVWSVVKRYLGRGHEAEDLYQIGCIGLIKAMQKFDTGYNVRFSTYAVPMIMGEIRRHLRDDGMIKVSRRLKELGFRAKAVQESLLTTLHREPTVNEVASAMGIEAVELTMAIEALQAPESLCDVSGSEDSRELIEKVEDCSETENDIIDRLTIKEAVAHLKPQERRIIILRYFHQKTQMQIADMLGISQVQISRIEKRALGEMRKKIGI